MWVFRETKLYFRILKLASFNIIYHLSAFCSLFHGFWQSFVAIGSCNPLMRIISTYVGNTKKSEISWRWQLFKLVHVQNFGRWQAVSLVFKPPSLPPSLPPDIFGNFRYELSNPLPVFNNTNCVTPPQLIFANLPRFPPKFQFPKNFDL